jgi:thiosulfate dehydrogenase
MKHSKLNAAAGMCVGVLAISMIGMTASWARPPFTDKQLADQNAELLEAVDHGRDLWHGSRPSMSSNGLACGNCHPDAAAANPQTWPKWSSQLNHVGTLREMINWCIVHPQAGEALDVNSEDMVALEAYAVYMYRGASITPGLATRQTPPVAVSSGVGYPKAPSGLGVDR